jgi:hypothetical protein
VVFDSQISFVSCFFLLYPDISRSRTPTENISFALPGTSGASIRMKNFLKKIPASLCQISALLRLATQKLH